MTENNSPLCVNGLTKHFPSFTLDSVSFELESGTVTGLIGRNGAGKTTALNCIMGFTRPDAGSAAIFGEGPSVGARRVKALTGFISAGMSYYSSKKLKTITDVTRSFYPDWDDGAYREYMDRFGLDGEKTPAALSNGMKIKYALALALSHGARLLILDEPTSGLDPVSREELIEIVLAQRDLGRTVLFSTHITSDLEKCADRVLYLREGRIEADMPLGKLAQAYCIAECPSEIPPAVKEKGIGACRVRDGWTVLVPSACAGELDVLTRRPTLDEIMTHLDKAPSASREASGYGGDNSGRIRL